MTRGEAIEVLGVFTAAWPSAPLPDDTVELWIEYLATVDADAGRAVAAELVTSEAWMPPIARFGEALTARRRQVLAGFPALPAGPYTPSGEASERISGLRDVLRSAGS